MTFGAGFLYFLQNASQCVARFPESIADSIDVPLDVRKPERMSKFHARSDYEFQTKNSMESAAMQTERASKHKHIETTSVRQAKEQRR